MVCNGLVMPLLLRQRRRADGPQQDMAGCCSPSAASPSSSSCCSAICFYRLLGQTHGLASIGLVSFAAIAQLAPAFFGGLIWRSATARGAIAGIVAGLRASGPTRCCCRGSSRPAGCRAPCITDGPFGLGFLPPQALFYLQLEPLTHGVLWSIAANIAGLSWPCRCCARPSRSSGCRRTCSCSSDLPRPPMAPTFRIWRTSVTVGDLQHTVGALSRRRARRALVRGVRGEPQRAARARRRGRHPPAALHRASAGERHRRGLVAARAVAAAAPPRRRQPVGAASCSTMPPRRIQYNRDLLQSALDQVRHGLERVRQATCG